MRGKGNAIRRIGVLAAWVVELYTRRVLEGIWEAARAHGVGVVCFAGEWVEPEAGQATALVYDFVSAEAVDGLIVLSATSLRLFEHLRTVAKRFSPLPMVSIGLAAPGVPGVVVDNETGFRREMDHLIEVHGRKRLAYLGGPLRNSDAQIRHGVYCEVLARHGMPLDRDLVLEGDFMTASGFAAAEALIERRGQFDAIVAANDAMALGALKALTAHGIQVPEEVSLVGFDDDPAGVSAVPALTTVRQPTPQVGRQAVEVLLDWLAQGQVTPCTVVPTEMVLRRSCGCPHQPEGAQVQIPSVSESGRITTEELGRLLRRHRLPGQERVGELMNACRSDLLIGRPARVLRAVGDALAGSQSDPEVLLKWQGTLSLLRQALLSELTDPAGRELAERLVHEARILVAFALRRAPQLSEMERHEQLLALNWISGALAKEKDLGALMRNLETGGARLGLQTWQVVLFEESNEWARVVYGRIDGHTMPQTELGMRLGTRKLLLDRLEASSPMSFHLVLPLHGLERSKGFLTLQGVPEDALMFVPLQERLSRNLKRLEREQVIRDALDRIVAVTARLREALRSGDADPETRESLERELDDALSQAKLAVEAPDDGGRDA